MKRTVAEESLFLRVRWLGMAATLCLHVSEAQQIALTFDDLPSHGDLPPGQSRLQVVNSIIATLKAQQLPSTYGFVVGAWANDPSTSSVLDAWRSAGQLMGNHSWSHSDLNTMSAESFEAEIAQNEAVLEKYMRRADWHWFRYPYIHEGDTLEKRRDVRSWLQQHGYRIAHVNMDFEDYLWNSPYARCVARHDEASIAKLHDSYLKAAEQSIDVYRAISRLAYGRDVSYVLLLHVGAFDARMLPDLISLYRSKGFTFVSLPEAIADSAYQDDPNIADREGGAMLERQLEQRKVSFPRARRPYDELKSTCADSSFLSTLRRFWSRLVD
jgi:peptidoglycan-N-acetylglucosamine deacetylase